MKMGIIAGVLMAGLASAADRPNILYINADDLGVMDVGYNCPAFHTPNIDRLAGEGMVFENGYAPAANCAPSRACVHSGQWGARHGVYTVNTSERGKAQYRKLVPVKNKTQLPPEVYTMAEALKDGGYRTIHLGKYHIGKDPLQDGFDVNIGGDDSGGPTGGYYAPWTKNLKKRKGGAMQEWADKVPPGTHRIDLFVQEAIRFMDAHKSEPMFIHFSPYLVHGRLEAVPEYVDHYQGTDLNATYASMVEKLDEAVGKLLDALDEKGLADKTLVVFCSDNGGIASTHSQKPLRGEKGTYYEGGVREPMLMRWPGKIKSGSRCREVVNSLDFYPTFMAVAGLERPAGLDGVSLLPLMTGSGDWKPVPQFWHFPIYLEGKKAEWYNFHDPLFRTRPGSSIRYGDWKLIEYFEDGALELYDLGQDGGEREDLSETHPEKTGELHRMLKAWRERVNAPVPTKANPKYDEAAEMKAKQKFYGEGE